MEEWRDIYKQEGRYQVSNLGRVRSFLTDPNGKLMAVYGNSTSGYLTVKLQQIPKARKRWEKVESVKIRYVHKLVAWAFLPNPNNHKHVKHLNGETRDNLVTNLEWADEPTESKHTANTISYDPLRVLNGSDIPEEVIREIKSSFTDEEGEDAYLSFKYKVPLKTIDLIRSGFIGRHIEVDN